jgi:glycine cleavage system aminomethyltransferase T
MPKNQSANPLLSRTDRPRTALPALRTTPFHERTSALCLAQNWRRWAGYLVAGSYELTLDREYWAIRNAAALIDVTPLMKYMITGRDAGRLLNRVVTRDVDKLKVGQVYYTPWCDEDGKVIDDGTISRLDDTAYRLTSADPNLRWLSMNAIGLQVEINEVTDRIAALSLQGPNARNILSRCCADAVTELRYFRLMQNRIAGKAVTISRTGYTGDLGYEIWMDSAEALDVWDALMNAGHDYGITPVGILAMSKLGEYFPRLGGSVLDGRIITPLDLESVYGLTEGDLNHGQLMLDQFLFMRPIPGWSDHRTPIDGLFLCGSGVHGGGGVMVRRDATPPG